MTLKIKRRYVIKYYLHRVELFLEDVGILGIWILIFIVACGLYGTLRAC